MMRKGFTLLELLLVIAVLSILASITIIAINPAEQFRDARDAERQSDVYTIMNALHQYASDNDGLFPTSITTEAKEICGTGAVSCTGLHDLSVLTDNEKYLVSIPFDPLCDDDYVYCSENGVGYSVRKTDNGRMNVIATSSENVVIDIIR